MSKIVELGPSKIKGSVGDRTFRQTQNGTVVTEKNRVFAGGFYKLISWDFESVLEQIAAQSEGAMRAL